MISHLVRRLLWSVVVLVLVAAIISPNAGARLAFLASCAKPDHAVCIPMDRPSPALKHKAIFVAPTFSHLPWYADHPSDASIRQETYFLKVVVPFESGP